MAQDVAKRKKRLRSAYSSWSLEEKRDAKRRLRGPRILPTTTMRPMKTTRDDELFHRWRTGRSILASSRAQLIMNPVKNRISREEVFSKHL